MNSNQRSAAGQHDGHALSVERIIDAPAGSDLRRLHRLV